MVSDGDFAARAERDIDVNLRTLSLAFAETFPDAKVAIRDGVVERIEMPRMPEFSDHKIVDRATAYVGGTATLFVFDDASQQFVRRTTNVKRKMATGLSVPSSRPITPHKAYSAAARLTKARRCCSGAAFTRLINPCSVRGAK